MQNPGNRGAVIVLMGPSGTGKSTFIHLLTGDNNIGVGHDLESHTLDVSASSYPDAKAGHVILVDTPGFDDSRAGITDTDTLGKIAAYLQEDGGRTLNGMIYLHRISDPRLGGQAKKNLNVFKELCGDNNLGHVRIVTTFWNRITNEEGTTREAALANGVFKPFIDAGAKLLRHDKELETARLIVSELVYNTPVTLKIQEELNDGKSLGDTSAGAVIIEEMKGLRKKHEKEMEDLRKEMEEVTITDDHDLSLELAEELRKLEEMMESAEQDRKKLEVMRMARAVGDETVMGRTSSMSARSKVQQMKAISAIVESQGGGEYMTTPAEDMAEDVRLGEGHQFCQQWVAEEMPVSMHLLDAVWPGYGALVIIILFILLWMYHRY